MEKVEVAFSFNGIVVVDLPDDLDTNAMSADELDNLMRKLVFEQVKAQNITLEDMTLELWD